MGEEIGCPRPSCQSYGHVVRGNVVLQTRYGAGGWRLLRCRSCGHAFSERRWTPLFRIHVSEDVVADALRRLQGGDSIRKVAEAVGVDKNTVMRILRVATQSPRWFQTEFGPRHGWTAEDGFESYDCIRRRSRGYALHDRLARAAARPFPR